MVWAHVRFNKSPHDHGKYGFRELSRQKTSPENESDIPVRELLSYNLVF